MSTSSTRAAKRMRTDPESAGLVALISDLHSVDKRVRQLRARFTAWHRLPVSILAYFMTFLDYNDRASLTRTCAACHLASRSSISWRSICPGPKTDCGTVVLYFPQPISVYDMAPLGQLAAIQRGIWKFVARLVWALQARLPTAIDDRTLSRVRVSNTFDETDDDSDLDGWQSPGRSRNYSDWYLGFKRSWVTREFIRRANPGDLVRRIRCPLTIAIPVFDWSWKKRAIRMDDHIRSEIAAICGLLRDFRLDYGQRSTGRYDHDGSLVYDLPSCEPVCDTCVGMRFPSWLMSGPMLF